MRKNRLHRENRATDCQEIEELRRICCEETDRARQARIDELSVQQQRNPTIVIQLLTQSQDLQNKENSLSDAREFYDPETASRSGATHVPSKPSSVPSPRTMPCRDSGLPHDTRNIMGTSGNVFERLLAREGRTSAIFDDSKNLASTSPKLGLDAEGKTKGDWNETRTAKLVDTFTTLPTKSGVYDHTGGTYSHSGVIDYPRFPISELHLVKFPDSMEFQNWRVNFKTEACSKTADPHLTMHWIEEVEIAKSIDELMTSRSIVERNDFPDFDKFDAVIASALKRFLDKHVHFRKRVSVEEQRAQKYDRFLRGRQNAYMIYEHFRATRAYEAIQRLSDLFRKRLQNDGVRDFDVR